MRFHLKVVAGVVVVMGAALLWLLFFRTSDEQAIEELCRKGADAAQRGDPEALIALVSTSYKSDEENYEGVCARIRSRLVRSAGVVEVTSFVAGVDGDAASATVGARGSLGRNELWRTAFALRLKREPDGWKVVSAQALDR